MIPITSVKVSIKERTVGHDRAHLSREVTESVNDRLRRAVDRLNVNRILKIIAGNIFYCVEVTKLLTIYSHIFVQIELYSETT